MCCVSLVSEPRSLLEKMPPRRQANQRRAAMNEVHDRDDLDRRIGQMIDKRLDAALERRLDVVVDRLAERMGMLMGNQRNANQRRRP